MNRWLEILNGVVDTIYVVFMAPGDWLASKSIEYAPSLAASLGITADESAFLAPLILSILSWTIVALLVRRLAYSLRGLAKAIGGVFQRLRFRILIAIHGYKKMLGFDVDSLARSKDPDSEEGASEFKLNRLDLIVLQLAKAGGPGFAVSAPELADRLNLRPDQIQQCLEKLSHHSLLEFTLSTTDGYENYRLNDTGSYVLTMWQEHKARA
jgi:hypothetical protein